MRPLPPVNAVPLFPEERAALMALLERLTPFLWDAKTACGGWSVKDVAAHILGADLARLSRTRDHHVAPRVAGRREDAPAASATPEPGRPEAEPRDPFPREEQVWVEAMRRLSPRVLIDLLRFSGEQTQAYWQSLDLSASGAPVAWAGPDPAPVWLEVAWAYTERWLRQQQIREAVASPGLRDGQPVRAVLETCMRALPYSCRDLHAPEGTHLRLRFTPPEHITRDARRDPADAETLTYSLYRCEGSWLLFTDVDEPAHAELAIDTETAWRLFTGSIPKSEAVARSAVGGDRVLAGRVMDALADID